MAKSKAKKRFLALRRAQKKGMYIAYRRSRAEKLRRVGHDFVSHLPDTEHPVTHKPIKAIECPEELDLDTNADETLHLFQEIHRWSSSVGARPVYINFKPIEKISPAAALMLAAELDRWNHLHTNRKLRAIDVDEWHPAVRRLLYEMGFFSLLNIDKQALKWNPEEDDGVVLDTRFLKFQSGRGADGVAASRYRDRIETFAGKIKRRRSLYDGLVEAMTNVGQHAYSRKAPLKDWWISASVNKKDGTLTIMCTDHGQGIPSTLPRKHAEQFRAILVNLGVGQLKDDAKMIQAAMDLERSRTELPHRGYGLKRDIQRYVSAHNSTGRLTILSGHGMYHFTRAHDGKESVTLSNNAIAHEGTLIEWRVEDF